MPFINPFTVIFTRTDEDSIQALKLIKQYDIANKNYIIFAEDHKDSENHINEKNEKKFYEKTNKLLEQINFKTTNHVFTFKTESFYDYALVPGGSYYKSLLPYFACKLSQFTNGEIIIMKPPSELVLLYSKLKYIPKQPTYLCSNYITEIIKKSYYGSYITTFLNSFEDLTIYAPNYLIKKDELHYTKDSKSIINNAGMIVYKETNLSYCGYFKDNKQVKFIEEPLQNKFFEFVPTDKTNIKVIVPDNQSDRLLLDRVINNVI